MEELFTKLLSLSRCTASDHRRARALLAAGEWSEREIVARWGALAFDEGTEVWLRGIVHLPDLNGDTCVIVSHDVPACRLRVRRQLTDEVLTVRSENVTDEHPDGAVACAKVLASAFGRDIADRIMAFCACQRCHRPCIVGSICRVPHPVTSRVFVGNSVGGMGSLFDCAACHGTYERDEDPGFQEDGLGMPGSALRPHSEYCFVGAHTSCTLRDSDFRRALKPSARLTTRSLQAQLDALHAYDYLKRVTITSPLDDAVMSGPYEMEVYLPNLESFETRGIELYLTLNQELTPNLHYLSFVDGSVSGEIGLLYLKCVRIEECDVSDCIDGMLVAATSLVKISIEGSCCAITELHLASNTLACVYAADMADLTALTIAAPNLRWLLIQDCDLIDSISLQDDEELKSCLPSDYERPTLKICLESRISPAAFTELLSHPTHIFLDEPPTSFQAFIPEEFFDPRFDEARAEAIFQRSLEGLYSE